VAFAAVTAWFLKPSDLPLPEQIREAGRTAAYLLLLSACTGVAAMATVQFWKVAFRPRAAFHARYLDHEFGGDLPVILGMPAPPPATNAAAARAPDRPAAGAAPTAATTSSSWLQERVPAEILDAPIEILMGQVRAGAEYLMVRPLDFLTPLTRLAGRAGEQAVKHYHEVANDPRLTEDFEGVWASRMNEAMLPVRFHVEQRLNLIHITLRDRWRWRVRCLATLVAAGIGALVILVSDLGPLVKVSALLTAGIWGGSFAWLARDLVVIAERRRS
jgi:hypothetical protein